MYKLVLIRHGESLWNKENRFTGWTDVALSEKGVLEAKHAGQILKQEGFTFDLAFTSVLQRAIKTLWLILEEMDLMWIPVERSWRLNERHYGALQGLNKAETLQKHGEEQFMRWRRSYDSPPPELDMDDGRFAGHDPKYQYIDQRVLPRTECLKDTKQRFLPYWQDTIVPSIKSGRKIIVAAHGNSLRALVMYLDRLSSQEIIQKNIPTGIPLVYELDQALTPTNSYYLGDPEEIGKAEQAVANQGQADK